MEHKRIIEVFTGGCPVCTPTVELVKGIAGPTCEVIIYNLSQPCDIQVCLEKAKQYGVISLPTVSVNGVLLECYQSQGVSANN